MNKYLFFVVGIFNRRNIRANAISRSVIYASLGNIVALIIGPITAYLVITHFSLTLQGFYYTFGSLLQLRFLADMGLGQTIIQFSSHEWAYLKWDKSGKIIGDEANLSRLLSLVRMSIIWYGVISAILMFGLGLIGYKLFSTSGVTLVNWLWPWFVLCGITGISFITIPFFALLQGCGFINDYWLYRLIVQIISGFVLWGAILIGLDLWSLSLSILFTTAWGLAFLYIRHRKFIKSLLAKPPSTNRISWRKQVWPVQWRIAIVWITSTFLVQMFTPIVFKVESPTTAGKVGLTLSLSMVLYALISNWNVTKAPIFGYFIARKEFDKLDNIFLRSLIMSILTAILGVTGGSSIIFILNAIGSPLAKRVVTLLPAVLFLFGSSMAAIGACFGVYLRAHKQEPLTLIYIVTSILVLTTCTFALKVFGVLGMAALYATIMTIFQLPWIIYTFYKSRRRWHHPQNVNYVTNI